MNRRWGVRLHPRGRRRPASRLIGRDLLTASARAFIDGVRAAAARGVDAYGEALGTHRDPRRAGERITLRRSGATLDGLTAQRRADEVAVRPTARHARHVFARFSTFELGDAAIRDLEQLATRTFERFLDHHREGS